jgi:protein gp37
MTLNRTIIAWTDRTWNPAHGCSRVSEGCRNCYAEQLSLRRGWTTKPWAANHAVDNVRLMPHKLGEPYKLKQPSRVFVNSMSDLFHELIPDDYLRQVFTVMVECPQHTFQVLTKRPERAARWEGPWPANIWMGTSIEGPRSAARIEHLRRCGAQVRFLSCEPLLAPLGALDLTGIHWVICGGESGKDFRPMDHGWARQIRDACVDQGVAYFFKQSACPSNERGTALQHEAGTFWQWHQFPGDLAAPTPGTPHRLTYAGATPVGTA